MKGVTLLANAARWRWMPCVALVSASVLYVLLVVAIVPERIGDSQPPRFRASGERSLLDSPAGALAATQPRSIGVPGGGTPPPAVSPPTPPAPPPPAPGSDVSRFGFSPPLPRAEPPPPPPMPEPPPQPPPPPVEAPPPAPPQVVRSLAAPLQAAPMQMAPPPVPAPTAPGDDSEGVPDPAQPQPAPGVTP